MTTESNEKRKTFSENTRQFLYDEVRGYCPICGKKLSYEKNGRLYKSFQIAHIYPVNPTEEQIDLLKNEERPDDVNDKENLLAVCNNSHQQYDHPRTVEEYGQWVTVKKRIIKNNNINDVYFLYNIEEELLKVIKQIVEIPLNEEFSQLSLDLLTIDQKTNETCTFVLKKSIKNYVVDYFNYIRQIFIEIDKASPNKFNTIASQIRTFYNKCLQINTNQEWIYQKIVDWLYAKTNFSSKSACEIIVAFFIQDCEVFS